MGAGIGTGLFIGGILDGIGSGLLERRRRQDKLREIAFQGASKIYSSIAQDPNFSGNPDAAKDLLNAQLQAVREYTNPGEARKERKAKGLKGGGDPLQSAQENLNRIFDKIYEPGRPQTQVQVPQTVPGLGPGKEETIGVAPQKGPLLTQEQKMQQQLRQFREQGALKTSLIGEEETARARAREPFEIGKEQRTLEGQKELARIRSGMVQPRSVPGLVTGADPRLQALGADPNKFYHVLENQGQVISFFEGVPPKVEGPKGLLGETMDARKILSDPKSTPEQRQAAKEFLEKSYRPPTTIINMGQKERDAKEIAEAVIRGDEDPTLSNVGRDVASQVHGILSKRGFNLVKARNDLLATRTWIRTQNSAQQFRLRQATEFTKESLDLVDNLSKELSGKVPRTQFPFLNRRALMLAKNGVFGEDASSIARRLDGQIRDLQAELATVYQGGNSPTDIKIKQAMDMLASDWSEKVLKDATDLARQNLGLRINSIKQTLPMGLSPGSPYAPDTGAAPAAPEVPKPSTGPAPKTASEYLKSIGQ